MAFSNRHAPVVRRTAAFEKSTVKLKTIPKLGFSPPRAAAAAAARDKPFYFLDDAAAARPGYFVWT